MTGRIVLKAFCPAGTTSSTFEDDREALSPGQVSMQRPVLAALSKELCWRKTTSHAETSPGRSALGAVLAQETSHAETSPGRSVLGAVMAQRNIPHDLRAHGCAE